MSKLALFFIFVTVSMAVMAHKKEHQPLVGSTENDKFALINEKYLNEVKPIFKKSCFDCHSSQTQYPWYYKIPGIHQLIDNDIKESREHLDFDPDFPFKSHALPLEDLKAIGDEVEKNEMPPLQYRLLHQGAALSGKEKQTIKNWVEFAVQTLNKETK